MRAYSLFIHYKVTVCISFTLKANLNNRCTALFPKLDVLLCILRGEMKQSPHN